MGLEEIAQDIRAWSLETFGAQSTSDVKLAHLRKEVEEVKDDPCKDEYADCFILLIDAWTQDWGHTDGLLLAIENKMKINKRRIWGPPDADGVREHVKCDHDLFTPEDTEHIKWGDMKQCRTCRSIINPDDSVFMESPNVS